MRYCFALTGCTGAIDQKTDITPVGPANDTGPVLSVNTTFKRGKDAQWQARVSWKPKSGKPMYQEQQYILRSLEYSEYKKNCLSGAYAGGGVHWVHVHPPPSPGKNVPLRNVRKRRESSPQICLQKRMCTFRSDTTKLKRKS